MMILITGGAGFIGSALVRYLIQNTNDSVVVVDCLTYAGNLESLAMVAQSSRYNFVQANICDANAMAEVFTRYQPTAVMHLAAESHVDRSICDPAIFMQTNIMGTFTLLEAVRKYWNGLYDANKDLFRFLHVSTDEVYGDLYGVDDKASEETSYKPNSPYSASKASSDHLVRVWHRTYGIPVVFTNSSNNYGLYQFPEKLIPHMILNALLGNLLPVYGDGNQIRDWLYVEDNVRALYKVLTYGRVGEKYNISGYSEKKNIDVVHAICNLLDELRPVADSACTEHIGSYQELISFVKDRPGHDVRYAIDAGKIQRELGWVPEESFETGIRKTVEWYISNNWW